MTEKKLLEALLLDPDFEQLETLLAEFNIFEAVGMVRQELRHSDFLAFLLSPSQNHGLGGSFLKRFLMRVLLDAPDPPLSAIEIDLLQMESAVVLREWRSIDVLIDDYDRNHLICVIENKIDTGEHSNQLQRYLATIERQYPDARVLPLFLSPEGIDPSDERYISVSYDMVALVLQELLEAQSSTMGPDVRTLVTHYIKMLRRHIVSNSDIAELCRKIYRKHQFAIDLLFEYRPDLQFEIYEYLDSLIRISSLLAPEDSSKRYIRFRPKAWDEKRGIFSAKNWTSSNCILIFTLSNESERLSLGLFIGPGSESIREALRQIAKDTKQVFKGVKQYSHGWVRIYAHDFLTKSNYVDAVSLDDVKDIIDKAWKHFLTDDLPKITQAILDADLLT